MRARLLVLAGGVSMLSFAGWNALHARSTPASSTPAPVLTALRVCADPNTLPFSNERGEGFENKLAALLAADLHRPVQYTWWAERRGFLRQTLNAGMCDVVMGLPARTDAALTTRPYYQSAYVFVTRADRHLRLQSLDDAALRTLRIGVPLVGDDGGSAPPAENLSLRGIVRNIRGYSVYGDYTHENPPAELVRAVADRHIDVALAWGPLAGYFAGRGSVPLTVRVIRPTARDVAPLAFDISMGVRRSDAALRARLNAFLERERTAVDALLAAYHVPRTDREVP
jgi:quinoprotein dehydrogenase-associated probable ABC transporter substrate-binding protein